MTRASISLSQPNDEWIQLHIDSKEFSSRSDFINDLIRKARRDHDDITYIRAKLIASEESLKKYGPVTAKTPEEMLKYFKERRDA